MGYVEGQSTNISSMLNPLGQKDSSSGRVCAAGVGSRGRLMVIEVESSSTGRGCEFDSRTASLTLAAFEGAALLVLVVDNRWLAGSSSAVGSLLPGTCVSSGSASTNLRFVPITAAREHLLHHTHLGMYKERRDHLRKSDEWHVRPHSTSSLPRA